MKLFLTHSDNNIPKKQQYLFIPYTLITYLLIFTQNFLQDFTFCEYISPYTYRGFFFRGYQSFNNFAWIYFHKWQIFIL